MNGPARIRTVALDEEQLRFVDSDDRLSVYLGRAGSGKTEALRARMERCSRFPLVIGLHRPALEAAFASNGVRIETPASLALEAMRSHPELFGPAPGLVLSDWEAHEIFEQYQRRAGIQAPSVLLFRAFRLMRGAARRLERAQVQAILVRAGIASIVTPEDLVSVGSAYDDHLRGAGLTERGQLLCAVAGSAERSKKALAAIFGEHDHVFIDDAHHLNYDEVRLALALHRAGGRTSLAVSSEQAFLRRRGGLGGRMLPWLKRQKASIYEARGVHAVSREMAHRFDRLLHVRDAVARGYRYVDELKTTCSFLEHEDTEDFLEALAGQVRLTLDDGVPSDQIAVICTTASLVDVVSAGLEAAGIAVDARNERTGLASGICAAAMGAVRLIQNPRDTYAFRRVARLQMAEPAGLIALMIDLAQKGIALDAAEIDDPEMHNEIAEIKRRLTELAAAGPESLREWLQECPAVPRTGDTEAAIDALAEAIQQHVGSGGWSSPGWADLEKTMIDERDVRPLMRDRVPVITLNDTIGRRWDTVHLVGVSDGLIPEPCVPEERAEERHALVQAMSRSTSAMVLHHVSNLLIKPDGPEVEMKPSPFAGEAGFRVSSSKGPAPVPGPRYTFKAQ